MISPVLSSDQGNDRYEGFGRTEDHDVVLQVLLLVLAAGLVVNSVLGPLILDVIDYSLSEGLRNQLVGLDAVSLVLVAPLCGIAALISRDRRYAST